MVIRSNNSQSHSSSVKLICTQINLARSYNATHELSVHLSNSECHVAFVMEPYTSNIERLKSIPGFTTYQFHTGHPVKAAILVRENFASTLGISEYSNSNICIVRIRDRAGNDVYLTSAYVEPRNDEYNTIDKLEQFLLQTADSKHVICGDFNGWHVFWGSRSNNSRGDDIADLVVARDLTVCNVGDTPTFHTVTHGVPRDSIVDLTLVSNSAVNVVDWTVDASICPSSDHSAVRFCVSLGIDKPVKSLKLSTYKYNTGTVKWELLRERFEAEMNLHLPSYPNFEDMNASQLNDYVDKFISSVQLTCDELLPKSRGPPQRAPWWNDNLEQLKKSVIKIHHKLSKAVRRKRPLEQLVEERDRLRREYSDAFCAASTEHFKDFCGRQKKEDVWSVTNRIIKTRPLAQAPATLRLDDGTYTRDSNDTARALLDRFYPDDTVNTDAQLSLRTDMYKPIHSPSEPPFTLDEILDSLQSMNAKRAPGVDHLTPDICYWVAKWFSREILGIINSCLRLEHFPKCWKIATAKIIPKPGKPEYSSLSSFRPIGLLNVFAKLLERLINNRLTYHMQRNNASSSNQYGFKTQISTVMAINDALEIVNSAKSAGEQVIAVSLDIKSAFDRAWWPAIFKRLRDSDCPSNLYRLLLSYIEDREIQINFADTRVSKFMSRGCIQGSVIGPTLWNLVLDELLFMSMPDGCRLQAYADDVLLIAHNKNVTSLEQNINLALDRIHGWGEGVKLEFGPDKTQAIAFTSRATSCQIHMKQQQLLFVDHIKYLGILIDNRLSFTKHVDYIIDKVQKLYHRLCLFIRPTWGIHPENVRIIYSMVIEPIVCYGAAIWSRALKYQYIVQRLLSLQRLFAIKMIQGFRTTSTVASISLAQLTPLPAKVEATSDTERSKLLGVTSHLPDDVPVEKLCSPTTLLHPSERISIKFLEISSASELSDLAGNSESWKIYTDGSKHTDKVGAAFVVFDPSGRRTAVRKLKLHDCCSVFQAELLAIREACEFILIKQLPNTIILSDSMSGLIELSNRNSHNSFAVSIHKNIHSVRSSGLSVEFAWVKAHVGLDGNEQADAAAKAAANLHRSPDYYSVPVSHIKHMNKLKCSSASQKFYENTAHCLYTKSLLPTYSSLVEFLHSIKPAFAITQYLTNHGFHKEYLHRFNIVGEDSCPCDGSMPQTWEHLLAECPRFSSLRSKYQLTCNFFDTDHTDLSQIITKESTIKAFVELVTGIVNSLKELNKR